MDWEIGENTYLKCPPLWWVSSWSTALLEILCRTEAWVSNKMADSSSISGIKPKPTLACLSPLLALRLTVHSAWRFSIFRLTYTLHVPPTMIIKEGFLFPQSLIYMFLTISSIFLQYAQPWLCQKLNSLERDINSHCCCWVSALMMFWSLSGAGCTFAPLIICNSSVTLL